MATVDSTPRALPSAVMKPLPESPGMPGVTVYTGCDQPPSAGSSPTLAPVCGESGDAPARRLELPYVQTRSPAAVPLVSMPVGPPQNGTDGFTLPLSAE